MDIIFDIDRYLFFLNVLTREYRERNDPMEIYELVIIHYNEFIMLTYLNIQHRLLNIQQHYI